MSSLFRCPYRATFALASTLFFGTVIGGLVYSLVQQGRLPPIALEYLGQADEWMQTRQFLRALAAYKTATVVAPDDDRALLKLGLAAYEAGQPAQATAALRKYVSIRPTQANAYYLLGLLSLENGAWDEAIRLNELALRFRPNFAEAHNNLGMAWQQKGHVENAISHYRQALQIDPFLEAARKNLNAIKPGS